MLNNDAKDILKAALSIANDLADGFDWGDIGSLMELPAAIDGWNAGLTNLKETSATEEGRAEIQQYVTDHFDIPDDELELKIEKSIAWLNATYDLYVTWSQDDQAA